MKFRQNTIIYILIALIVICAAVFSGMFFYMNKINVNTEQTSNDISSETLSESLSTQVASQIESSSEQQSFSISNQIETSEQTKQTENETSEQTKQTENETSPSGRKIVKIDENDPDWNLVVVNSQREIPKGYVPKIKEVVNSGYELDYRVAPFYEEMYYAAKKDGIILTPYSGYRSYERQSINYNNLTNQYMSQYSLSREDAEKKAATVILPAGTSEHNLGLAMDICNTYDSFADTQEYAWLMKNAHKYGFILRYTAEKQSITGIVPEPWHWRFVGVEYAEKIKNSGLCLEEYLESIGKQW